MQVTDPAIGTFPDHFSAGPAIKKLTANGFFMNSLSIIDKGRCTDEKAAGFYDAGDRIHEIRP